MKRCLALLIALSLLLCGCANTEKETRIPAAEPPAAQQEERKEMLLSESEPISEEETETPSKSQTKEAAQEETPSFLPEKDASPAGNPQQTDGTESRPVESEPPAAQESQTAAETPQPAPEPEPPAAPTFNAGTVIALADAQISGMQRVNGAEQGMGSFTHSFSVSQTQESIAADLAAILLQERDLYGNTYYDIVYCGENGGYHTFRCYRA